MKRIFQSMGIAKKLLGALLLVSVIPIMISQMISYYISSSTIKRQTSELIEAGLIQSASSIEDFYDTYNKIITEIYSDEEFAKYLSKINVWDNNNYQIAERQILTKLKNITYINKDVLGIAILGKHNEMIFYDSYTNSIRESYFFDDKIFKKSNVYKQGKETTKTLFSKTYHKWDSNYGDSYHFYISHPLVNFNAYRDGAIGSVILCVKEDSLYNAYNQAKDSESNMTFVINEDGDIISFPQKEHLGKNIFEDYDKDVASSGKYSSGKYSSGKYSTGITSTGNSTTEIISIENGVKEFFHNHNCMQGKVLNVSLKRIMNNKFTVVNVQDVNYTIKDLKNIANNALLMGIMMSLICILISMQFTETIALKVKLIIQNMDKANAENYDVEINIQGGDEFAQIGHHFNSMVQRIKRAIKLEREALIREKNAEIRSLEAQINPHFIYNVLDAINWVAVDQEQFKISRMVNNLAVILRHTIHKSNEIVTIQSELEYLKKYIYLQQERFEYSFKCTIEAEDEILHHKIHKLILQPLIENAIEHAFPSVKDKDEIFVFVHGKEEGIEILVEDNGKGMTKQLVDVFNSYDYQKENIETSIGVRNVITRIKLYYGEIGYFHIDSDENGTKILVRIPYGKEEA